MQELECNTGEIQIPVGPPGKSCEGEVIGNSHAWGHTLFCFVFRTMSAFEAMLDR